MIKAEFLKRENQIIGFIVSGHANAGRFGQDIVCAGVSSAVMLAVNTITDFMAEKAEVKISKNVIALKLSSACQNQNALNMVLSLKAHLEAMASEYGAIDVIVSNTRY